MDTITEISKNIAKNLTYYRKEADMTQAELAEKINYSDKSVSKWESGNGIPDVYTLMQIAELFGITLNDLVGEGTPVLPTKERRGLRAGIMLLASGIVWLVATCLYVLLRLIRSNSDMWYIFLYAIAVNAIVVIVFAGIWKYRFVNFVAVSVLIWISLLSLHVTFRLFFPDSPLWLLYILGVPLQVLECMWGFFRAKLKDRKRKEKQKPVEEKQRTEEVEE